MDVWVTAIGLLEISALIAAVEIIVTIFKVRAPGMSMARMPIFVWAMLVMSFMILFAMPAVLLATIAVGLDRMAGTHFFNARWAATRRCTSTSSGSSGTPRCTSSSRRRSAWWRRCW
jgi:heme/copper-type cytochrome/quinol oxidase subunit 1